MLTDCQGTPGVLTNSEKFPCWSHSGPDIFLSSTEKSKEPCCRRSNLTRERIRVTWMILHIVHIGYISKFHYFFGVQIGQVQAVMVKELSFEML